MTVQAASVRSPARDLAIDSGVAAAAFALTLALLHASPGTARDLDPLGVVLAAVASIPLVARRRSPLGVFAVTTAASAALNALGYAQGPPFGPTIALFFVAADERSHVRLRRTAAIVLGLFAVHIAATAQAQAGFPTSPVLFGIVVWGCAWMIGDQVRQRRGRAAEVEERARRSERDTERERRLAAAEERTRIARDLHDSAGHAINVILVQAGAARLLQERDPDAVRAALTTIEDVARETIGEIDQLVRALRDDTGDAAIEPPSGLSALETIVGRHRAAGLDVHVEVRGRSRPLPPAVDHAAYRILQEALTNAAQHGLGAARADVAFCEDDLEITVTNATRRNGAPAAGGGHGLVGMRERVALLHGSLAVEHHDGLHRLCARLPYAGEAAG